VADPNLADAIACLREYGWTYAADTFESQAARIAELEAALKWIADHCVCTSQAVVVASRALASPRGET